MRMEQLVSLCEKAGIGHAGQDLFIHYMNSSVSKGIVFLTSLTGDPIDWELPGWRKSKAFQAIVRDPSITSGYRRSEQLISAITINTVTTLPAIAPDIPAIQVAYIRPIVDTIVYPRTPDKVFEFSTNFEAGFAVLP